MCSICSYSLLLYIEMFSKRCKTAHVCHLSFEQLEQCGLRTPQCTIQGSIGKPDNQMVLKVQISQIVGYKFLLAFWTLQSQRRSLFPWSYAHFQHSFSIFEELRSYYLTELWLSHLASQNCGLIVYSGGTICSSCD